MNTHISKYMIAVVSALTLNAPSHAATNTDLTDTTNALVYNNRAYVQETGSVSNPDVSRRVENAEIIFVSNATGPSIYSYPSSVAHQATEFNVEFVDMAYGPAIYSYPNNNPKFHLELGENREDGKVRDIMPASFVIPDAAASNVNTTVTP